MGIAGQRYATADVNQWPSKKVNVQKTARPTSWAPPSYEKERAWMKNYDKPTPTMPTSKYGTKTQATNGRFTRLYSNDEANKCPSYDDFDMNAPCDYVGQCEFGEETCCGETYASLVCQCGVERSFCYYTDACLHTNCDPLDKILEAEDQLKAVEEW